MAVIPLCACTGGVVRPKPVSPQTTTEPLVFNSTLWYCPAEMALTSLKAIAGTIICPKSFVPHETTELKGNGFTVSTAGGALVVLPAGLLTTTVKAPE